MVLVLSAVSTSALFIVYGLHMDHLAACTDRPACNIVLVSPPNLPVVRGAYEIAVQPFPQTMIVQLTWNGVTL